MIPKKYDQEEAEDKWYKIWEKEGTYSFNYQKEETYIIDTPPPYPTGNFHVGNALNWCYIDFAARYNRMIGKNVNFPQGWDCHGLPTEVKVEEKKGITKNEIPREKFIEYCKSLTEENIKKMKSTMKNLGFSIDWDQEYVTMNPEYWKNTQKSFLQMLKEDEIYKAEHPVNWCPRCETAIAYAEVEHEDRKTKLNYIKFPLEDSDELEIATTRPELLPACVAVAVNPNDERFEDYVGEKIKIPLFGHKVEVIADEEVDTEFGTGAVMICTFGDKQDVEWWNKYNLDLRNGINKKGHLTEIAQEFEGESITNGKKQIIKKLDDENYLNEQEEINQSVGLCWRCDTPIEILSENQWFVKVHDEEIIEKALEVDWFPEHMFLRLENWVEEMEWDWCISRQRIFGTPIPVWYCKNCDETIVAKEEELPLDPRKKEPLEGCNCNDPEIFPETDVLDTWMDSSISPLYVTGWPNEDYKEYFPTQLRPQGHDIIRTWAFYTILRSNALTQKKPWDDILINGMVFGEDGNKMSKSLGNIVAPEEVINKEGADPFRLWAATGGSPGNDIQFKWKDVKAGKKFLNKIWNVLRFTLLQTGEEVVQNKGKLRLIDKWILTKLDKTIKNYKKHMDKYDFQKSVREVKSFLWDDLADNYLEMVKHRLYQQNDQSAKYTMFKSIDAVIKMIAPFAPFFAEEGYSNYSEESVHNEKLPKSTFGAEETIIEKGNTLKQVVETIRRYKSDQGIPLNSELDHVEIFNAPNYLNESKETIENTIKAKELDIDTKKPEIEMKPSEIKVDMSIIGPRFKKEANEIKKRVKELNPQKLQGIEELEIETESVQKKVPLEAIELIEKPYLAGREVEILGIEDSEIKILISK